jgi:hypothetical protein
LTTDTWEANTAELNLKEELRIKGKRGRVERYGLETWLDMVRSADRMRGEEGHQFSWREIATICHSREYSGKVLLGLGDETIRSRSDCSWSSSKELELRGSRAERDSYGSSKLNKIASRDIVGSEEGSEELDRVADSSISGEIRLNIREDNH